MKPTICVYLLWSSAALAQSAAVAVDVNPGGGGSNPEQLTALGDRLVFTATDTSNGPRGLYVFDPSTSALSQLVERPEWTTSTKAPHNLAATDTQLFFLATTTDEGEELWRTDGTVAGTMLVKDIIDGSGSPYWGGALFTELVATPTTLYTKLSDNGVQYGDEVWSSDGTPEGTDILADLRPGTSSSQPTALMALGERLFWFANDGSGMKARTWDGATLQTIDGLLYANSFSDFTPLGTQVLAFARTTANGLFLIDPVQLTYQELALENLGACQGLVGAGSKAFIGGPGVNGTELWASDGTAAGTGLVTDIHPTLSGCPKNAAAVGDGKICFYADDGTSGVEPWCSDGTVGGTNMLLEINAGSGSEPKAFTAFEGDIYFIAKSKLWKTDGVAGATAVPVAGLDGVPTSLAVAGGKLFASAFGGNDFGRELVVLCDGCVIGGVCYDHDQVNPGNPCEACQAGSPSAWTPLDAISCDDGDLCTSADVCVAGTCMGAAPTCPDNGPCVDPSCDPATGDCTDVPVADGSACDDSNACTQSDSCLLGSCVGADPVVCAASDQCHDVGTCEPSTGLCSDPVKSDGALCDDADACTQSDSCQLGVCSGANPVVCTALSQCHDAGICNPTTGFCSDPPKDDGVACNDGNACTQTDSCNAGGCVGTSPVVCTASDSCHVAGVCSPATGTCSDPPALDGTACDDGEPCSTGESCTAGSCGGGAPTVCDDGDPCTTDSCAQGVGCQAAPGGLTCNDLNPCTDDACVALQGCVYTPNTASCDDGNACSESDACLNGNCVGTVSQCADGNPCTDDTCDDDDGCAYLPNALACDDGEPCTVGDVCANSACAPGAAKDCDDGNPCTADQCVLGVGCTNTPTDGAGCDDGDDCTENDVCAGDVCGGTTCTSPSACLDVVCLPSGCSLAANTAVCDDGDPCTTGDQCDGGTCSGTPVVCSDTANPCTTSECQAGACTEVAASNGVSCSDGDACTQLDVCQAGVCVGSAPVLCADPIEPCTASTCNASTGQCVESEIVGCGQCDDHPALCVHDLRLENVAQTAAAGPGAAGTIAFTVTNDGPDPTLAQLRVVVPLGAVIERITVGTTICAAPPTAAAGEMLEAVFCTNLALEPGESRLGTVDVATTSPAGVTVAVFTVGTDPVDDNNSATVTLDASGGTVAVSASPSVAVAAGAMATQSFTITSSASSAPTGTVTIAVEPAAELFTLAGCDGTPCTLSLGALPQVLTMGLRACEDITTTVTVDAMVDGEAKTASAQALLDVTGQCSPCGANPAGCTADLVLTAPTDLLAPADAPLTVENLGPDDAVDVIVQVGSAPPLALGDLGAGQTWSGAPPVAEAGALAISATTSSTDPVAENHQRSMLVTLLSGELTAELTLPNAEAGVSFQADLTIVNGTGHALDNVAGVVTMNGTEVLVIEAQPLGVGGTLALPIAAVGCGPLLFQGEVSASITGTDFGLSRQFAESVQAGEACECLPQFGCDDLGGDECNSVVCDPATLTCVSDPVDCDNADPCLGSTCVGGACLDFLQPGYTQGCADGVALSVTPGGGSLTATDHVFTIALDPVASGLDVTLTLDAEGELVRVLPSSFVIEGLAVPTERSPTVLACSDFDLTVTAEADGATVGQVRYGFSSTGFCDLDAEMAVGPADAGTFDVTLTNTGNVALPLDFVLSGAGAGDVTAASSPLGVATLQDEDLVIDALLGAGETTAITFEAVLAGPLAIALRDPFGGADITSVNIEGIADLALTGSMVVEEGAFASATITGQVTNNSGTDVSNARLLVNLPPPLTTAGGVACSAGVCALGNIGAGDTVDWSIITSAAGGMGAAGEVRVEVTSDTPDSDPSDHVLTAALAIPAAVEVTLVDSAALAGESVPYEFAVRNLDSAAPISAVAVRLTLSGNGAQIVGSPSGVLITDGCTVGATICGMAIAQLGPGESRTVALRVSSCGDLIALDATATVGGRTTVLSGNLEASIGLTGQCAPPAEPVTVTPAVALDVDAGPGDTVLVAQTDLANDGALSDSVTITGVTLDGAKGVFDEVSIFAVARQSPPPDPATDEPAGVGVVQLGEATVALESGKVVLANGQDVTLYAFARVRAIPVFEGGAPPLPGPPPGWWLALLALLALAGRRWLLAGALTVALVACSADAGSDDPTDEPQTVVVNVRSITAQTADGAEIELLSAPITGARITVTK